GDGDGDGDEDDDTKPQAVPVAKAERGLIEKPGGGGVKTAKRPKPAAPVAAAKSSGSVPKVRKLPLAP
ncbi:MAG: hypothetical protein SGJ17_11120, partial [Hyphomicrobiales bacterium]|nr:hypothetical protein [Hyphomicrobiales bacterium]